MSGIAHVQMVSPVSLFRATMVASGPPGVQISLSPSMSGDSQNIHTDIIFPPKSSGSPLRLLIMIWNRWKTATADGSRSR